MKQFNYKNGIAERISESEPETIEDFQKLGINGQKDFLHNFGNKTWKMQKEVTKRKSFITKCQDVMFGWKRDDGE